MTSLSSYSANKNYMVNFHYDPIHIFFPLPGWVLHVIGGMPYRLLQMPAWSVDPVLPILILEEEK